MGIKVIRSNGSNGSKATASTASKATASKATASTASKATASKATASKATASTASKATANTDIDASVSLFTVKNAILNSIASIAFSSNNVNSRNTDTQKSLLDELLAGTITKEQYAERLEKLGKTITNTGDFRGIASLNNVRVSSNAILSESLLKGKKGDKNYTAPASALAVYRDNAHYDNICKLQSILTLLLNIGEDVNTSYTSRDFELALYKCIHVAQSKAIEYGIKEAEDSEKRIVDIIKFKKAE